MKAPWPDFAGNPIHEGDIISHPESAELGRVWFNPDGKDLHAKWMVKYSDGLSLRLCLQIGDKGMATVYKPNPKCTGPEGNNAP